MKDVYPKQMEIEYDTHSDTGYNFPFAVKSYITDDTEIIGDLQKEKM